MVDLRLDEDEEHPDSVFMAAFAQESISLMSLSEAEREAAYETLSPLERAEIKNHIAVLHKFYGERTTRAETLSRSFSSGCTILQERQALKKILLHLPLNFASAPCLVAAAMPAILSGVEKIEVMAEARLGEAIAPVIPAALDLLGLERLFVAFRQDQSTDDGCRLRILRGDATPTELACRRIGLDPAVLVETDLEDLQALYPQAELVEISPAGQTSAQTPKTAETWSARRVEGQDRPFDFDAIISREATAPFFAERAPLILPPDGKNLWIWPQLSLDFFLAQKCAIITCT